MLTLDQIKTIAEAVCAEACPGGTVVVSRDDGWTFVDVNRDGLSRRSRAHGDITQELVTDCVRCAASVVLLRARQRALGPLKREQLEAWGNRWPLTANMWPDLGLVRLRDDGGKFYVGMDTECLAIASAAAETAEGWTT